MKRRWTARILLRYSLIQGLETGVLILALFLIRQWVSIPPWLFWSILMVWVFKDAVLFPFVWRAFDWDRPRATHTMVGEVGIAQERLTPSGYVRAHGELWYAEAANPNEPIDRGKTVRVIDMRGLTLVVKPEEENL
jgi:membrane-bound ClpP family serine protease